VANEVTSQEIARLLGKCLLFQALGEEERHSLVARMRQRTFKSRDPIFHVGAPGQSMLVILKGSVRVSLPGPKGKVVILADARKFGMNFPAHRSLFSRRAVLCHTRQGIACVTGILYRIPTPRQCE